jgi:2-polyprenyl-3-methyl-5-hydroxy-6-metoxy-1,4-benzoquinol methylase
MASFEWEHFWQNQKQSFNEVMKISTTFFGTRLEKLLAVTSKDEILDYGCGPGFLVDYLAPKKISVTGVDINSFFLEQSKKNHPGCLFISITTDVTENKRILDEHLKGQRFDFIILLSIVQYFKDLNALHDVIAMLRGYMKENGKIVIADVIDSRSSSMKDAMSLFGQCLKKGKSFSFFMFMFYLLFSNYNTISRQLKLLKVAKLSMDQIANNNAMLCEEVKHLTLHSSRTSYVLTKKNG